MSELYELSLGFRASATDLIMKSYEIYGLSILSEFELGIQPKAFGDGQGPDLCIHNQDFELPDSIIENPKGWDYLITTETMYVRWKGFAKFKLHAGKEIKACLEPGAPEGLFLRILKGTILGLALFQKGFFILHAGAVVHNDATIAVTGNSGYGKSTIISTLHAKGFALAADDICAILNQEGTHILYPGIQEFKLWPDSAVRLGQNIEKLDRVSPAQEKRVLQVSDNQQDAPLPLKAIYVLDFAEKPKIEPVKPGQAVIELVRNTYGITLLDRIRDAAYFEKTVALANSVPVYRLYRTNSMEDYDQFLGIFLEHLEGSVATCN